MICNRLLLKTEMKKIVNNNFEDNENVYIIVLMNFVAPNHYTGRKKSKDLLK